MVVWLALASLIAASDTSWKAQPSGVEARLRGLAVVSESVAWASGSGGTVLRTIDGGVNWTRRPVPGAEALDFRDLHAFDDRSALLLAIGPEARVYATGDGGASWDVTYQYREDRGFLDAIAMFDRSRGLILGDPVDGRYTILATDDGGKSWRPIAPAGMPPARVGEGAFAASGTCLTVLGDQHAWFCTGGAGLARVFRSTDGGTTWTAAETPIKAGNAASGAFSIAFRDVDHGIAVGGDYQNPEKSDRVAAWTDDGGATWHADEPGPRGYRSAVGFTRGRAIAVGPSGCDVSDDGGRTWRPLSDDGYDALGYTGTGEGWSTGEGGRIGRWLKPGER